MPLVLNMSLGCSCDIGLQQHRAVRNGILSYSLDIQYTWSSSSTPVSWNKWELSLNCQTTEMIPQCYLRMGVVPGSNITHPTRSYQVAIHFVKCFSICLSSFIKLKRFWMIVFILTSLIDVFGTKISLSSSHHHSRSIAACHLFLSWSYYLILDFIPRFT